MFWKSYNNCKWIKIKFNALYGKLPWALSLFNFKYRNYSILRYFFFFFTIFYNQKKMLYYEESLFFRSRATLTHPYTVLVITNIYSYSQMFLYIYLFYSKFVNITTSIISRLLKLLLKQIWGYMYVCTKNKNSLAQKKKIYLTNIFFNF